MVTLKQRIMPFLLAAPMVELVAPCSGCIQAVPHGRKGPDYELLPSLMQGSVCHTITLSMAVTIYPLVRYLHPVRIGCVHSGETAGASGYIGIGEGDRSKADKTEYIACLVGDCCLIKNSFRRDVPYFDTEI